MIAAAYDGTRWCGEDSGPSGQGVVDACISLGGHLSEAVASSDEPSMESKPPPRSTGYNHARQAGRRERERETRVGLPQLGGVGARERRWTSLRPHSRGLYSHRRDDSCRTARTTGGARARELSESKRGLVVTCVSGCGYGWCFGSWTAVVFWGIGITHGIDVLCLLSLIKC